MLYESLASRLATHSTVRRYQARDTCQPATGEQRRVKFARPYRSSRSRAANLANECALEMKTSIRIAEKDYWESVASGAIDTAAMANAQLKYL